MVRGKRKAAITRIHVSPKLQDINLSEILGTISVDVLDVAIELTTELLTVITHHVSCLLEERRVYWREEMDSPGGWTHVEPVHST